LNPGCKELLKGDIMDYWKECISVAANDCGLSLTEEQLECLVGAVESGHENYRMALGYNDIPNPVESRAQEELRQLKIEKQKQEEWKNSTKPCRTCVTSGCVTDIWGRDIVCPNCDGRGRV
jgi:hypothetical protein